ncbi:tellurite resistance TerB family protein [Agarivorans sp. DSG3-1]|uniref:tellurite resistance TerB family protein n=1 Tax=Agarivorans sp. DSG3-1 TaxID=3342249 RepID=UPI00398E3AB0
MSIQNLLNQFMGSSDSAKQNAPQSQGVLGSLSNNIPGGLAGGAAAGGLMALLVSNKSARKFAGKAATVGGAAVLGGLAFSAFSNWKKQSGSKYSADTSAQMSKVNQQSFSSSATLNDEFQLTLIKAMIAAAKADGHIDDAEQQRIFEAVEQMALSDEAKATLFQLMRQTITIEELANGVDSIEQKSELYLVSCIAINVDNSAEQAHLDGLAYALRLPFDLAEQLQKQAQQALDQAA